MSTIEEMVIYRGDDAFSGIEMRLYGETLWLTQAQLATLFDTTPQNITMHLRKVFREGELDEKATCKDFLQVREEGGRTVRRMQKHYDLDAALSVGYRVKSLKATQFRIWATQVLREHLIKGYTLNTHRLSASEARFQELRTAVRLVARTTDGVALSATDAKGILDVLEQYAFALETLDRYDHGTLEIDAQEQGQVCQLNYEDAMSAIAQWRRAQGAGELFGNEKDGSFHSSLNAIYQTFDGRDLYPSIEEKAAHLLYFVVKNHSFSDGNKRIAAGLFVHFLNINKRMLRADGSKVIGDNALVAMTIMVAESRTEDKDVMVKLIVNLISDH